MRLTAMIQLDQAATRVRLWRARRRHHHIDAQLSARGGRWALEYRRDDRPLVLREFEDEGAARDDATGRLNDLLRAGWVVHW